LPLRAHPEGATGKPARHGDAAAMESIRIRKFFFANKFSQEINWRREAMALKKPVAQGIASAENRLRNKGCGET
jgi:hypothetical protein